MFRSRNLERTAGGIGGATNRSGDKLITLGAGAVVVKGGHLEHPEDILIEPGGEHKLFWGGEDVRLREARGTGCILASLVAAQLLRSHKLSSSMKGANATCKERSKDAYIHAENAPGLLMVGLDSINDENKPPPTIAGIYFVTGPGLTPKSTTTIGARLAAEGGARVVHSGTNHNLSPS